MNESKRDVLWSARAEASLDSIVRHIAQDNPSAAVELVTNIVSRADDLLGHHPQSGRPGRVGGTRELMVHKSYILAYRVAPNGDVQVLDIIHSARLWPETF